MTARETKVVLLTAAAHGQAHLFILAFSGVVIPMAAEFRLTDADIGWLGFVAPLFFGLWALPAGLLADRVGARWVIAAYLLGSSTASVLVALAESPTQIAIALALLGSSASLYHPAGLSLLTRTVRERGKALGYHGMAGSAALALAPMLAGWLSDAAGSWRTVYFLLAIPGFLLVPGILFLREDEGEASAEGARDGEGSSWGILVTLYFLLVILGLSYRGVLTFLPKLLQERVGGEILGFVSTPEAATWGGLLAGVALFAGVPGQWMGGQLSQKLRLETLTIVLVLLTAGALLSMGLLEQEPLLASSLLFAFFYFALQPVGNGLVARYTTARRRSLAYGISFTLSFGVGAAGSAITGEISHRFGGMSAGMLANGFLMIVGAAGAVILFVLAKRKGSPTGRGDAPPTAF